MRRPAGPGQESRYEELEQSADFDDAAAGTGPVKRPGRRDGDDEDEDREKGGRRRSRRERERAQREALSRARRERTRKARADLAAKAKGEEIDAGPAKPARSDAERDDKAKAKGERPKQEADAKSDPVTKQRRRKPKAGARSDPDGKAGGGRKRAKVGAKSDPDAKTGGGRKRAKVGAESGPDAKSKDEPPRAKGDDGKRRPKDKPSERKRERPKPRAEGKSRLRGADKRRTRARDGKRRDGAKRVGVGAKRAGTGALVALKRGATETGARARKAAPKLGRGAFGLLVSAFAIFFSGLGLVLQVLIAVYLRIAPPVTAALRLARRAIDAVSRQVTPIRVLALVVAGAAVLLALSQFADYRNISIGNDAYAEGLQTVAPAPVRETAATGSAHSYLMVPLAAVALILLGASLTGRWRFCRLIALVGVVAIAVALIHDRPTGLDVGDEAIAYTGVKATLLGGFYAQLFSGLLLALSGLLLGRELRLAGAGRPVRASRALRRLQRRNPRVEGASA